MYTGIIYKYENVVNHKVYIGQTTRPRERRVEHLSCSKSKKDHFHNALRKWGIKKFSYEVLEVIVAPTQEELYLEMNQAEKYWISEYQSDAKDKGYNICEGGNSRGIRGRSLYLFDKFGVLIRKFVNYREAGVFLNRKLNGLHQACARKQLIKGRYYLSWNNTINTPNKCKSKFDYFQIDKNTNEVIKRWESVMDIEKELGFCASTIIKCCNHPEKYKSYKGFKWSRELKTHNRR